MPRDGWNPVSTKPTYCPSIAQTQSIHADSRRPAERAVRTHFAFRFRAFGSLRKRTTKSQSRSLSSVELGLSEAAVCQQRDPNTLRKSAARRSTISHLERSLAILELGLLHRPPGQRHRSAVRGDQVHAKRGVVVGLEVCPVHRDDDAWVRADHEPSPRAKHHVSSMPSAPWQCRSKLRVRPPDDVDGEHGRVEHACNAIGDRNHWMRVNPLRTLRPRRDA